jgi:hypothetical protein
MEKKLTDEEIVKALENCNDGITDMNRHSCDVCPYKEIETCGKAQMTDCLDLIHRLQDENAELKERVDELEQLLLITKTNKSIEQKKTVKEYAEKLKLRLFEYTDNDVSYDEFCKANVVCGEIDDICREQYGVEVE